jgi:hypothetical protein
MLADAGIISISKEKDREISKQAASHYDLANPLVHACWCLW